MPGVYRGSDSSTDAALGFPLAAGQRDRAGRPVTGSAVARPYNPDLVAFPLYGPWGRWYPWYTSGFGWNLGFVTYNPWNYGATRWVYGRYGLWYDPWAYYPYYEPYYDPYYRTDREEPAPKTTGAIRVKANVKTALVYIDNALVGTVDEFDGLRDHLELDGGRHVLELRAEGYQTITKEINVEVDKTLTERFTLKRK